MSDKIRDRTTTIRKLTALCIKSNGIALICIEDRVLEEVMLGSINYMQDFCNMNELNSLLKKWSLATGLGCIVIGKEGVCISGPFGFPAYCQQVRSCPEGNRECTECSRDKLGIFRCHAGLYDYEMQVFLPTGEQIAAVFAGHVAIDDINSVSTKEVAEKYNLDQKDLDELLQEVKIVSREEMEASCELLSSIMNSFVRENYEKWCLNQELQLIENSLYNSGTGIWSIEAEEGKPRKMLLSKSLYKILGVPAGIGPEEVYSSWTDWVYREDREVLFNASKAMEKNELSRDGAVFRWNHPEKGIIYLRVGGKRVEIEGKKGVFTRGYIQHITENVKKEKEYQVELERALQEAQKASHVKSDFLSRISRDVRTPITSILGMSKIARDYVDHEVIVTDALDKIDLAGEQLAYMINEILDMNQLITGEVKLTRESMNINDVLNGIESYFVETIKEKEIEFLGVQFLNSHQNVIGSPIHVKKILKNLVSNAFLYNIQRGHVEVVVSEDKMDANHSNFHFVIRDTGIGISKEKIDEFLRNDEKGAHSSGFGISISKTLIERMGGHIEIDSVLGEGTTVQFWLPLEIEEKQTSGEGDQEVNLSGMSLLLVEDTDINLEIAEYLLSKLGAMVTTAQNGKEAVEIYNSSENGSFDAILMDLVMPEMDGFEATKLIRESGKDDAKSIPIIAMTANALEQDIKRTKESGMNAHISKPINAKKLAFALYKFK